MYIYIHTYICMYVYMYICLYVYICIYMLYIVYIIYICIYIPYTYTPYIYVYTSSNLLVDKIYLIVVTVISKLLFSL